MPVEIAIPFRVADDGGIAFEENPDRQIAQHVRSLVGTEPGERVMLPTYGVDLGGFVFDPDDEIAEIEIAQAVTDGMARFEPGAIVQGVTPLPTQDGDGIAMVEVLFTRSEAPGTDAALARNVNTAEVRVGGEVREAIRG